MPGECPRKKRRYESESVGERTPFQRDRDRVLYCEAFRRLSGVSQVAYTGEAELYHDRLSHSLKVAQVGRRIAEYLDDIGDDCCSEPDPDVVETAALAHDIGHPPFGHPAERELDELIKEKGISEGFEGNAQSLRTISHVAVHPETDGKAIPEKGSNDNESEGDDEEAAEDAEDENASSEGPSTEDENTTETTTRGEATDDEDIHTAARGLNLTRASLNAMIKYPWSRSAESGDENEWGEDESDKFGRYANERELFHWIRSESDGKRRSVEAEIMDWADDLVYAVHDVDDFYRAGVIPLEQILRHDSPERDEFIDEYLSSRGNGDDDTRFGEIEEVEEMLDKIAEVAGISHEFSGTRADRVKTKDVSSQLIERYIGEGPDSYEIAVQEPDADNERYFTVSPRLRKEVDVLKYMLIKYVLDDPAVRAQRRGERKVIEDLFEIFYEATQPNSEEDVEVIHQPFREKAIELEENGDNRRRVRLVTDIITSMTEQQAIRIHKRLTGDAPGSLQETIIR